MARLLVCTESEEVVRRISGVCESIGWEVEQTSLDRNTANQIAARSADAAVLDLEQEDEDLARVAETVAETFPFFPLMFIHSRTFSLRANGAGIRYFIEPDRLEDLEHILISLSCAGFPVTEGPTPTGKIEGGVPRVLIVEDDVRLASLVARSLRFTERLDVVIANSGFQATAMLPSFRPNVVLVDMSLGDMDGREVCAFIRDHARLKGTRVIGVSGYLPATLSEERGAYFDAYVEKPFVVSDIVEKIRTFLV